LIDAIPSVLQLLPFSVTLGSPPWLNRSYLTYCSIAVAKLVICNNTNSLVIKLAWFVYVVMLLLF